MNSHYNGYFNANVLYEDALAKLNDTHKDNYNQILDIYPYEAVTLEEAKSVKEPCDNVVKKMSKVVATHRISEWTDDCYLLVGKAYFLKKDYESAEEALRFASDEFNPDKPVFHKKKGVKKSPKEKKQEAKAKKKAADKKKKEAAEKKKAREKQKKAAAKKKKSTKGKSSGKKERMDEKSFEKKEDKPSAPSPKEEDEAETPKKPKDGKDPYASRPFHRRPAYPEIQLWMGRTMIERDKNDEAEFLFNQMSNNPLVAQVEEKVKSKCAYKHRQAGICKPGKKVWQLVL